MKNCCENYYTKEHNKINLSKDISCCLTFLLEKYDEAKNLLLEKSYGGFLIRTINHYYKSQLKLNHNSQDFKGFFKEPEKINIANFNKFLGIISHFSVILYKHKKIQYNKLILAVAVDLIDYSHFKSMKPVFKKKVFFLNNLACIYSSESRYIKAEIFFNKCIEVGKKSLDYAITYNNYCMIEIKKIKSAMNLKNKVDKIEINKLIENVIYYLHLGITEIQERVKEKYSEELNKKINKENKEKENDNNKINNISYYQKKEVTCYLLYNYLRIVKCFIYYEYLQNYENGYKIIETLLGKEHFITIKMARINSCPKNNDDFLLFLPSKNKIINKCDEMEKSNQ